MTGKNRETSPFYSRNYGGYSPSQVDSLRSSILGLRGSFRDLTVLDPMSGQAHELSKLVSEGSNVCLGDINPAALCLAALRDPDVVVEHRRLYRRLDKRLSQVKFGTSKKSKYQYSKEWIPSWLLGQLQTYAEHFGLDQISSPFSSSQELWDAPMTKRFAACLAVLAARKLVTFQRSDNKTWLKQGGLVRVAGIVPILRHELERWESEYATPHSGIYHSGKTVVGTLRLRSTNAEQSLYHYFPRPDVIVTSPPYANRLDYSRLWAPEIQVLKALWPASSENLKSSQIGSTVVKAQEAPPLPSTSLPPTIRRALEQIRDDGAWGSSSYYYKFFCNYAQGLARSLESMAAHLKTNGLILIFFRDTVRKDVLFPTVDLVRHVLRQSGLKEIRDAANPRIIRHHVGLIRKHAEKGLYGLAQREWWLSFLKE